MFKKLDLLLGMGKRVVAEKADYIAILVEEENRLLFGERQRRRDCGLAFRPLGEVRVVKILFQLKEAKVDITRSHITEPFNIPEAQN